MGRSNKKRKWRRPFNNSSQKRKRGKHERFWIEDCNDSDPTANGSPIMEVLITRVELEDDYHQIPRPKGMLVSNEKKEEAVPQTDDKNDGRVIMNDKPPNTSTKNPEVSEQEQTEPKVIKEKPALPSPLIYIKRTSSAKGKLRKTFDRVDNFKPLPNGDCGDGIVNPYPKEEVPDKFWSQRRRLFTRFDEGIQLDKESWYSVTPEAIANHISASMVSNQEKVTILDLFCGCGGNAIGFACREEVQSVICVDKDIDKLKMAAHNAKIYGIAKEKMTFIHAGACQVLHCYSDGKLSKPQIRKEGVKDNFSFHYRIGEIDLLPSSIDMVFISPPWGGESYIKVGKRNYDLSCIEINEDHEAVNGEVLLQNVVDALGHRPTTLFLPKNINGVALGKTVHNTGYKSPIVLEQNILNGKLKTVTAYLGKT